mmetsp:Transcript_18683/g.46927  ORF Transcript_18683/g.46927 Transcript_18683/m.46927 type:complete len:248 (+) Transcript_18683:482-1225(+)
MESTRSGKPMSITDACRETSPRKVSKSVFQAAMLASAAPTVKDPSLRVLCAASMPSKRDERAPTSATTASTRAGNTQPRADSKRSTRSRKEAISAVDAAAISSLGADDCLDRAPSSWRSATSKRACILAVSAPRTVCSSVSTRWSVSSCEICSCCVETSRRKSVACARRSARSISSWSKSVLETSARRRWAASATSTLILSIAAASKFQISVLHIWAQLSFCSLEASKYSSSNDAPLGRSCMEVEEE